jgi:transposase InsO family protein
VQHDIRDQVVDFVTSWSRKCDTPVSHFLPWIDVGASKFHDWRRRFGKVNEHNAWVPRDHWLTEDEKECIAAFARAHPLEGYRRLSYMMLDTDVVACSAASVYRTLRKAGLLAGASPNETKKGKGFVQPLEPHQHWHIDVSYLNLCGTFYFLCSILDGCSRFIVHHEIREKMEDSDVQTIVQRAREAFPNAHPRIISDNGPQFVAKDFKEFIRIAGMTHVKTSPYYPQSNGKIERWHKSLKGECLRPQVPLSLEDARRQVSRFVQLYNQDRLHSAIGYITPKDRLEGKHDAIFAQRDRKLAEARERRQQVRQTSRNNQCQPTVPTRRRLIDFQAIRASLTIATVLDLLGCTVQARGGQHRGPCPLHGSTYATTRCFSANLEAHCFHCFKCGRTGNVFDLWAQATKQTPYHAALDLCERLNMSVPFLPKGTREEEPVASVLCEATMSERPAIPAGP